MSCFRGLAQSLPQMCLSSLHCFLLATLKLQSTNIDRASQALAEGLPEGVSRSFRALADHSDVARTTLQHRARGRRSKEQKAKDQQYLYPWEEKALAKFLIQQDALGRLVRIKHVRSIASVSLASGPQQTDHASLHIGIGLSFFANVIQNSLQVKAGRWTGTVTTYVTRSCTGSKLSKRS
jgi:hypothetical protein